VEKLLRGLQDFRVRYRAQYAASFAALALRHEPDALMLTCGDSRVVPNIFASTDPGDLFVIRNVGNILPPPDVASGERVALEFAIGQLRVKDVIICGHSECAAMRALVHGDATGHLKRWLKFVKGLQPLGAPEVNTFSRANVCFQLERLRQFPFVRKAIQEGRLKVHGWWFDLEQAYLPGLTKKSVLRSLTRSTFRSHCKRESVADVVVLPSCFCPEWIFGVPVPAVCEGA
jgi:carbonic anhydrase